jgi:hypothetical protein
MSRIARIASPIVLLMLAATMFTGHAWAQAASTETVTIQLDSTTPMGTHLIGALVIKRTVGTGQAALSFDGTINGLPASATANATETWPSGDRGEITVTEITSWNASVPRPNAMKVELAQVGPGVVTINGIPMAASGAIRPPGSGSATYTVTNPGQGTDPLSLLPKTGDGGVLADPLLVVGFLVAIGPALVVLGTLLGKLAGLRGTTVQGAR